MGHTEIELVVLIFNDQFNETLHKHNKQVSNNRQTYGNIIEITILKDENLL